MVANGFVFDGNQYGTNNLINCTVSGNSATDSGGGLVNGSVGTIALTNSTFSGNSAVDDAGGLFANGGSTTLTNCTFSDNSAGRFGGGLQAGGDATLMDSASAVILRQRWRGNLEAQLLANREQHRPCSGEHGPEWRRYRQLRRDTVTIGNTIVAGNTADAGAPTPSAPSPPAATT